MSTQYSGKRRRTFDKPPARGRRAAGMLTNRDLGMFLPKRAVRDRARGVNSHSVFQNPRPTEQKVIDVSQAFASAAGVITGTISTLLNPCAQGIDFNQHIGRVMTMKSLYWRYQGGMAPNSTGNSPIRLVILYDKESEGVAPTIAAAAQTDAFNEDTITAANNLNNRDRFVVLVDEIIETIGTAGPQSFYRKGYRKVGLPVVFNAVGATVASINTGAVYAFVWQNSGIGVAAPGCVLDTRIRFEDA